MVKGKQEKDDEACHRARWRTHCQINVMRTAAESDGRRGRPNWNHHHVCGTTFRCGAGSGVDAVASSTPPNQHKRQPFPRFPASQPASIRLQFEVLSSAVAARVTTASCHPLFLHVNTVCAHFPPPNHHRPNHKTTLHTSTLPAAKLHLPQTRLRSPASPAIICIYATPYRQHIFLLLLAARTTSLCPPLTSVSHMPTPSVASPCYSPRARPAHPPFPSYAKPSSTISTSPSPLTSLPTSSTPHCTFGFRQILPMSSVSKMTQPCKMPCTFHRACFDFV